MRVIGYTYDADVHCVACAKARWSTPILAIKTVVKPEFWPAELDENGFPVKAVDREGNPVHPVFSTDEGATQEHCGDCHELLYQ